MLPPAPPLPPAMSPTADPAALTGPAPVASTKDGSWWRGQIQRDLAKRQRYEKWWDQNMKGYAPSVEQDPAAYGSDIHTNRTFTLVERKKADEFYQRPDVSLVPTPRASEPVLRDGQPLPSPPDAQGQPGPPVLIGSALTAHEEIVNEYLGDEHVDATAMMDEVMFDVIATQGVGFTKMGYESYTNVVPHPTDPLAPPIELPVHESCFWEHFSGKQAIIPSRFRSTNWDKAPYLGMQFELPLTESNKRKYQLPPDFTGKRPNSQQRYDHGDASDEGGEDIFTGVEIFYRSVLFRTDRVHPEHLTQLVIVDGIDEPVIERDCQYQTLTPEGGLTPDSLIGNPIHPFSVRTMTDSAYVPSDGTMIRPLENELDIFRTQMVQFRDAQTLRYIANSDTLPADALQKIVRSPIGGIISVPPEAYNTGGEGPIKPLEGGSMPRESFQSNDYIDNDLARTCSIDAPGSGVQSQGSSTATEQQIVSANANARLDKERAVLLKRYVKGVTKFATLLQRYLSLAQATEIVGTTRAQTWDVWRTTASATCSFTALPDSALRVDQAVDRKQAQDLYTYLAKEPNINRQELLKKLLRKFHLNPDDLLTQPPPPAPEPPKISLTFKAENLNPYAPEYTNTYQVLSQNGIKNLVQPPVDPATALQMQAQAKLNEDLAKQHAPHGGKAPQAEGLDKHAVQDTGGMQGTGMPAALGAPGGQLQ